MTRLMPKLLDIAADQFGFIATADARAAGIDPTQLRLLCQRGQIERRAHGIYFIPQFGVTGMTEYMEAVLWAKGRGVIAGESALALWDLADVNPRQIRLAVPPEYNPRKRGKERYRVERRSIPTDDITTLEGIPVTTPKRSIRDALTAGTDRALIRQAIASALERGLLTKQEAEDLTKAVRRTEIG